MRTSGFAVAFIVLAGCASTDPVTEARVDELQREGEARGAELGSRLALDEPRPKVFGVVTGMIAAITRAVNDGEIVQAELALNRADDPDVVDLAALVLEHHTAANLAQDAILATLEVEPIENPVSATLRAQNAIAYATLAAVPQSAFDRAYLDTQIVVHAEASALLRAALPFEPSAAFRGYLVALLDAVEIHLAVAIDLRLDLGF